MAETRIIDQIRSLKKLTPSELKIAEYFSRHEAELVFENVTSISKNTGVSKATVVRFIARLGYKKFADFRNTLRNEIVYKRDSLPKRYSLKKKHIEHRQEDILGENISYIMQNLQYTHEQIDPKTFLSVARMLMDPKAHLFITGQRTSYPLAYLFHMLITRLRPESTLIGPEISMLPDTLSSVSRHDVLLAIFRHPYGRQTLKVSQFFSEREARIILITDSAFSPASKLASVQLTVPSKGLSIFNSFSAVTALLESLNIAALKFCNEEMIDRLENGEKLLKNFEVFCPGKSMDPAQIQKLKGFQNPKD